LEEPKSVRLEPLPTNDRILSLSDCVFAFAMTLLVLGIDVPRAAQVSAAQLPRHVLEQWPSFLVWVISFLVIGSFWMAHHRLFKELQSHDDRLAFLNLVLLLGVAFLPFPTALIGQYSNSQFAVILYAASMFLTSSCMSLIGWHAAHAAGLVRSEAARRRLRDGRIRGLTLQAVCLVSVAVSFVTLTGAMLCWALIPFAHRFAAARFGSQT